MYEILILLFSIFFFFFNAPAPTEIYTSSHTLSLHDALPISHGTRPPARPGSWSPWSTPRSEEHTSELQSRELISYAVFCLKKKKKKKNKNSIVSYKKLKLCGQNSVLN